MNMAFLQDGYQDTVVVQCVGLDSRRSYSQHPEIPARTLPDLYLHATQIGGHVRRMP